MGYSTLMGTNTLSLADVNVSGEKQESRMDGIVMELILTVTGTAIGNLELEPAQTVQRYLGALNLKSYWNVHAYSQLVLTPWSWTSTLPSDYTEIKRVGDIFARAV